MRLLFVTLGLCIAFGTAAQKLNRKAPDPKKHGEMLVGYCNRDGFATIHSNFDSAFKAGYSSCYPDATLLQQIKSELKGIRITVVLGTWCGDSRDWVPRLYCILDKAGFNPKRLTAIAVDRERKAPVRELGRLQVQKVPTIIVFRGKREIGRIVEVPDDANLEAHLLRILQTK